MPVTPDVAVVVGEWGCCVADVTLPEGLRSVEVAAAVLESAETGATVSTAGMAPSSR